MEKISINMLSSADKIDGQGVGSAYLEQVNLIKEGLSDKFDVRINDIHDADILHHHTVDPWNLIRMRTTSGANVCYVHFLPETLDGSIKLPKMAFGFFKKYVTNFYNNADHLVVVNPIFINDLVEYGIPREKITYIPNYVSKEFFYEKSQKEIQKIRKNYEISKDAFVVLGVGQVQTRKGVKDFVEIARMLPDITFVWCGGFSFGKITDGYEELKELWENPPENLQFLGIVPRSEMNNLYNMSDILFMPSYNELFPMSILEAANCKKPLLLRNLDLYKDILFNKYISASDNNNFKEEILKLKSDKEYYHKYQKLSWEVSEYYSKDHVLKLWDEFYTKVYNEHQKKLELAQEDDEDFL